MLCRNYRFQALFGGSLHPSKVCLGVGPLLLEIRWKAGPFLEAQEGVPSPQSSLLPALGCPSQKQKTESNTALPQVSSLLPTEHFPGATAEGSPSFFSLLPPSPHLLGGAGARREPTEPGEIFLGQKPQDTRECTSDH